MDQELEDLAEFFKEFVDKTIIYDPLDREIPNKEVREENEIEEPWSTKREDF